MSTALDELYVSPRFPQVLEDLQTYMAKERARREKFYAELTEDQKAEFVNGEVIVHSPARIRHLKLRNHLQTLLTEYVEVHQLGFVAGEKALCVFPRNDYEPDVCFFSAEKAAQLRPEQLKLPIPDFIAEVLSESTERLDRGVKFQDYQAHGVAEYWLVDPEKEVLEQYVLREGAYVLEQKSGTGEVRSQVVPGFKVPIRALFDARLKREVLRRILAQE
jgi:Uma2 family endonuclease